MQGNATNDISTSERKAWDELMDYYGDPAWLRRHLHISLDHRFVYVNNPKVACSTTKATLNSAVAADQGQDFSLTSMGEIHDRKFNPLKGSYDVTPAEFEEMMTAPDVLRFTFVRDPVLRLISAYLSKIACGKGNSKHVIKLRAHAGWQDGFHPTIEDVVALFETDEEALYLNQHWRPQFYQVGWEKVDLGTVGYHGRFNDDMKKICARIFGREVEVFDTRKQFGKFTSSAEVERDLSPELRERIKAVYADDYRMMDEIGAKELWVS